MDNMTYRERLVQLAEAVGEFVEPIREKYTGTFKREYFCLVKTYDDLLSEKDTKCLNCEIERRNRQPDGWAEYCGSCGRKFDEPSKQRDEKKPGIKVEDKWHCLCDGSVWCVGDTHLMGKLCYKCGYTQWKVIDGVGKPFDDQEVEKPTQKPIEPLPPISFEEDESPSPLQMRVRENRKKINEIVNRMEKE
jgi:hypothetical protein